MRCRGVILVSFHDGADAPKLMTNTFLKFLREYHGYTQQRLADALGIAQPRIAEYESGKHAVPRWMRPELAALGWVVSVNDTRLLAEHSREVVQLFERRNVAPEGEIETIDEQIIMGLLGETAADARQ